MKRQSLSTTPHPVVLLVQRSRDDSLEMYAEFLRYHGLTVIPVSDARNALKLVAQADIVVTGLNLDDPTDGVERVSRLRHEDGTRSTPIIVLTACAWPKDRARLVALGLVVGPLAGRRSRGFQASQLSTTAFAESLRCCRR